MTDTLASANTLMESGFTNEQAQALVTMMTDNLATKEDIEALRLALEGDIGAIRLALEGDIEALRLALGGDIEALRLALEGDIEALRLALEGDIEALRIATKADLKDLNNSMTIRLGFMLFAGLATMTAIFSAVVGLIGLA